MAYNMEFSVGINENSAATLLYLHSLIIKEKALNRQHFGDQSNNTNNIE